MNIFLLLVLINMGLLFLMYFIKDQLRKWKTRKIFRSISTERKLETFPVKVSHVFSQSTKLGIGANSSVFYTAEIFFDKDLLILVPKSNSIFSGARAKFLPIVFTDNCDSLKMEIDSKYLFVPDYIKLSTWDSLTIKNHTTSSFSNEYLSFQIKPKHKKDSLAFRKIGDLKLYIKIANNVA